MKEVLALGLLLAAQVWGADGDELDQSQPGRIEHDGIGARVEVSSTHTGDPGEKGEG